MKLPRIFDTPRGSTIDDLRAQALGLAIVLRNCALRVETSAAGRRACRFLMRRQAIQWRQPAIGRTFIE